MQQFQITTLGKLGKERSHWPERGDSGKDPQDKSTIWLMP